ncbi:hypothetical protein [Pseudomonas sp. S36]|uniref:hypothetical protein n=1 Tax=Pseudomonas sp. S36 TaxID=2767447 RepID=UPI001912CC6B|nr:hypothetical protein [Pseudomonas sp. S36]
MKHPAPLLLPQNHRLVLAQACSNFPGKKLDEVITRALCDIPKDQSTADLYEIRRTDVPRAFDALLKLQNTGLAHRYIEVDQNEFWEVLRIEVTLLDAILLALAMILDIIKKFLASDTASNGEPKTIVAPPPPAQPFEKPYIPTWKRGTFRVGFDGPYI